MLGSVTVISSCTLLFICRSVTKQGRRLKQSIDKFYLPPPLPPPITLNHPEELHNVEGRRRTSLYQSYEKEEETGQNLFIAVQIENAPCCSMGRTRTCNNQSTMVGD